MDLDSIGLIVCVGVEVVVAGVDAAGVDAAGVCIVAARANHESSVLAFGEDFHSRRMIAETQPVLYSSLVIVWLEVAGTEDPAFRARDQVVEVAVGLLQDSRRVFFFDYAYWHCKQDKILFSISEKLIGHLAYI